MVTEKDNRSWVQAYNWIKKAIDVGALEAGMPLPESMLCSSIGISRTPIREALRKLELDNYVKIIPSKGAFVSEISLEDIREIYEIRKLLEPFAALSATYRVPDDEIRGLEQKWNEIKKKIKTERKPDFTEISNTDMHSHLTIIKYSNNLRIQRIMSSYHYQIRRSQFLSARSLADIEDTIRQHLELVNCLKDRDALKLHDLLYEHIVKSEANIMRSFFLKSSRVLDGKVIDEID